MNERLLKIRTALTAITGYAACALLFGMLCLVLMQVFTRYVMNDPASFTEELVRYMLIWTLNRRGKCRVTGVFLPSLSQI